MLSKYCFKKTFIQKKREVKKQKEVKDAYACFGYENVENKENIDNQIHFCDCLQGFIRCVTVALNK